MDRPLAVLSDFDGTITTSDIAEDLLARFAPKEWEEVERLHRARVIGTRETMARQFALVRAGREELVEYARRTATMDKAVPAFVQFCRSRHIPFEIVSEGLDFYLHALIKSWSLDVPVRTNRAVFDGGRVRIEYPFADPTCTLCGTCKLDPVFELPPAGPPGVYIRDGGFRPRPPGQAGGGFAQRPPAATWGPRGV